MKTIKISPSCREITLGMQGENAAAVVEFDVGNLRQTYGDGTPYLFHRRPCDAAAYPVAITTDGDTVRWVVTAGDTAQKTSAAPGRAELVWIVDETLAKSVVWRTYVGEALETGGETPPDAVKPWYDALAEQIANMGGASPEQIQQAVADYLLEHPIEEADPTVFDWAKQPEKPTYTASEVGALDADTLKTATEEALRTAKESGEFDGATGQAGPPGKKGDKGDDYVLTDSDREEIAEEAANKIKPEIDKVKDDLAQKATNPTNPVVGQWGRVKKIDEDGNPVWETAELPIATTNSAGVLRIGTGLRSSGGIVTPNPANYTTGIANRKPGELSTNTQSCYAPITPNNADYMILLSFTDGLAPAWDTASQLAALARLGITVDDDGICRFG